MAMFKLGVVFIFGLWGVSLAYGAPLEPPKTGAAPAPIHSDALKIDIVLKTKWSDTLSKPKIARKILILNWDGETKTQRGDHYPELYAEFDVVVPVNTQLNTKSNKPLKPAPFDSTHDYYRFRMPIRKMNENRIEYFARFFNNEFAEFYIDAKIVLTEGVSNTHRNCDDFGLTLKQVKEAISPSYFFARCEVDSGILYLNALKAKDLLFSLYKGERKIFETYNQPVARFVLPVSEKSESLKIAEMTVGDARFELWYQTPENLKRAFFYASFGLGIAGYREADLNVSEFVQQIGIQFDYLFRPTRNNFRFENTMASTVTIWPIVSSSATSIAARWWNFEERLNFGWKLNPDSQDSPYYLWVSPGYHFVNMLVEGGVYGFGFKPGMMLQSAVTYEPYGRAGWRFFTDYSTLRHYTRQFRIRAFFSHELDWFSSPIEKRRFSLFAEYSFMRVEKERIKPTVSQVVAGVTWRL